MFTPLQTLSQNHACKFIATPRGERPQCSPPVYGGVSGGFQSLRGPFGDIGVIKGLCRDLWGHTLGYAALRVAKSFRVLLWEVQYTGKREYTRELIRLEKPPYIMAISAVLTAMKLLPPFHQQQCCLFICATPRVQKHMPSVASSYLSMHRMRTSVPPLFATQ